MIFTECPGPEITDDSREFYDLFFLAHTPVPAGRGHIYHREVSFTEMLELPAKLTKAWHVISAELLAMQKEI